MAYIDGNEKAFFGRIQGAVPMGLVKLEPGGYFRLHWHNGEPGLNPLFITSLLETELGCFSDQIEKLWSWICVKVGGKEKSGP